MHPIKCWEKRSPYWCTPLPNKFFWNGFPTAGRIALKFRISYGAPFAQLLAGEIWPGQVRWWSYDVIRVQPPTDFSRKSCFQPRNLLPLTGMEILYMIQVSKDHIWPLTLHLNLSKFFRGHWPWLTPYIPIMANLAILGVSWGPDTEYVAKLLHRHAYSASLHYSTSIMAVDTVCPQAILPMRVTLFPSRMLCPVSQILHPKTVTTP